MPFLLMSLSKLFDCQPAVIKPHPLRATEIMGRVLLCTRVHYDDVTSHRCSTDLSLLHKSARRSRRAGALAPSLFLVLRLRQLSEGPSAVLRRRAAKGCVSEITLPRHTLS